MEAISELVRIWHSPHLDLSLKAGLAEVIETLKEKNQSDSLVRDEADDCKENKSKLDLIDRQLALAKVRIRLQDWAAYGNEEYRRGLYACEDMIISLPSAEQKTKCIAQIKIDRDDIEDMVNEKVNEMVDKMAKPKTGKWVRREKIGLDEDDIESLLYYWYECSECGNKPPCDSFRNEWHSSYCPSCGARMTPYKGGDDE